MPKRWLKGLWFENGQRLACVAQMLGVSTRALSVRLYYLGLAPETPRCARPARQYERPVGMVDVRYLRRRPAQLEAVA